MTAIIAAARRFWYFCCRTKVQNKDLPALLAPMKINGYEAQVTPGNHISGQAPRNETEHACLPDLTKQSREGSQLVGRIRQLADSSMFAYSV